MKRSKMVEDLAAMLSEFKDFPLNSTENEADFILKHLVDTYGMLPPERTIETEYSEDGFTIMDNSWEPENEKK